MKSKGFVELKERQMGQQRVFSNGQVRQNIFCISSREGVTVYEWSNCYPDDSMIEIDPETMEIKRKPDVPETPDTPYVTPNTADIVMDITHQNQVAE